jgi:hypothetical protein
MVSYNKKPITILLQSAQVIVKGRATATIAAAAMDNTKGAAT